MMFGKVENEFRSLLKEHSDGFGNIGLKGDHCGLVPELAEGFGDLEFNFPTGFCAACLELRIFEYKCLRVNEDGDFHVGEVMACEVPSDEYDSRKGFWSDRCLAA